ncbi:MAG TPA: efflux RND transporter periplasmic adaptor subunit [Chthoniobacterales bacterium]|nr:efflux RND transporter periplasmic adaptor subunit [Chthoniobacterales bacterium]
MKLPVSKKLLWSLGGGLLLLVLAAVIYIATMPVAEVAVVRRGTAISAVYGTVRIEPILVIPVRAQNSGFIRLADAIAAGRPAIGKTLQKGELLATIADETTARQLKQAQTDLQAARQRAELPLPSAEPLKVAEDNLQRLERLTSLSNVPAIEYEKARSEVNRLRSLLEAERIERDRNLEALDANIKKLEALMQSSEIRAPIDGLLTNIKAIDGELVSEGNELFTVSSPKNYVRGEVNEEDVGEVKIGMPAVLQVYAFRNRQFNARVSAILPAADPETQRYTIALDLENPPENLLAGMTGEMNIITGQRENVLLVPTRALLVDQVLVVRGGVVRGRTVNVGYRTLDFAEAREGVREGEYVIVSDQDRFHPGKRVRKRVIDLGPEKEKR